ncbi:VWA domain-containing protein [Arcobacter sp. s6]|uniref:vWA domain-containing protein n=1 Tax=Arcobacter sp. s6 TaxID=3230363 RepID=UPI002A0F3EC5|nr:VWA domain-containing protein [Arcobacter sp.]
MFYFKNIEFLYLLLLIIPLIYLVSKRKEFVLGQFSAEVFKRIEFKNNKFSKTTRAVILIFSFVCLIFALARPIMQNGEIRIKSSFVDVLVAVDISKSMMADDIYPNRFEFEKNRLFSFLDELKNIRVALVGFSSQTFLISPLTEDFNSLKFLVKNLRFDYLNLKGTNIKSVLEVTDDLLKDEKNKILLIFTDGGNEDNFENEIAFAKTHNITIYVYNIGTLKGGIIKDENNNAVLVKLNENIKKLALDTNGAYLQQSLNQDDIKQLSEIINNNYKAQEEEKEDVIKDEKELFIYPLILAIILFFMGIFSLPRRVS